MQSLTTYDCSLLQALAFLLIVVVHDALLVWGAFTLANRYFGEEGFQLPSSGKLALIPGGGQVTIGSGKRFPYVLVGYIHLTWEHVLIHLRRDYHASVYEPHHQYVCHDPRNSCIHLHICVFLW